ncbi:hypothetical protein [Planococcus sp. MB-3u-03]|uniref:hypothetical protein n=1 Tax=Planococcus sp. MB-3u-03 TaxID=2058136 RepID=UPI002FCDE151
MEITLHLLQRQDAESLFQFESENREFSSGWCLAVEMISTSSNILFQGIVSC